MFSTLESTWDRSARRGWSTLASFGFQVMALSLLLLMPLIWIQGPPSLQWFEPPHTLTPPPAPAPPVGGERRSTHSTNLSGTHLMQPPTIPTTIAILNEQPVASAPNIDEGGVVGGTGTSRGMIGSVGPSVDAAPPPAPPAPTHPITVSHWAEGNLIYRVQPAYPEIARQIRVQGPVQLQAIISKAGTIEHLTVESGHPMLVKAAMDAVRQWRYRPYLLNGEPVEVETEITVNFVLGGS
jgi:protein TonB